MTAAVSLIHALAMKYPDEYKGAVTLSVSRLSRVCTYVASGDLNLLICVLIDSLSEKCSFQNCVCVCEFV